MKRLITTCLVCVLLTAAASQGMVISFDENGNGSWTNDQGQSGTLEHGMGVCPAGQGANWETLYYELPGTVVQADLWLEYGPDNVYSDALRFVNVGEAAPTGRVYFYSDVEKGDQSPLDLADTGLPGITFNGDGYAVGTDEQGTEDGWSGLKNYIPDADWAGYMYLPNGELVTYNITSDVPEPATICLLGLGGLLLGRIRKQK